MTAQNKAAEPGTLSFNSYMNKEETILTFVETYTNADTFQFHAERYVSSEFAEPIWFELAEHVKMVIYGDISQTMIDWGKTQGVVYEVHQSVDGFIW